MHNIHWLDWPALKHVKACYTSRAGGVSVEPYESFNMGEHVGDDEANVESNRRQLLSHINQRDITWLEQVHGTEVINLSAPHKNIVADACFSQCFDQVCCIMTADCLPVFFCDQAGSQVALAHAGWRGLLNGVLENTLATFSHSAQVMIYLGPAISQKAFVVGEDVRAAFVSKHSNLSQYFVPSTTESAKWMADLYGMARTILTNAGVTAIYGGTHCTYTEADTFFSYRREGVTGRMANLIWLEKPMSS